MHWSDVGSEQTNILSPTITGVATLKFGIFVFQTMFLSMPHVSGGSAVG